MNTDTPAKSTVDVPLVMPTVQEIALIAATLARNTPEQTPNALADAALKLYIACDLAVLGLQMAERKESAESMRNWTDFETKELPVTRDVFFQRMLPESYQNRADELAKVAMEFLKDRLRRNNNSEPTLDEVTEAYKSFGPFGKITEVALAKYEFREWYDLKISKVRRAAGMQSGTKRKVKKKL